FDHRYPIILQGPLAMKVFVDALLLTEKRGQFSHVGYIFESADHVDYLVRLGTVPFRECSAAAKLIRNLVIAHGVNWTALAEIRAAGDRAPILQRDLQDCRHLI